jgi:hypothetical protein
MMPMVGDANILNSGEISFLFLDSQSHFSAHVIVIILSCTLRIILSPFLNQAAIKFRHLWIL